MSPPRRDTLGEVRAFSPRLVLALGGLVLTGVAPATPAYLDAFLATYQSSGRLKAASCGICHTNVPKHNAYGLAVNAALRTKGEETLTAALLQSIEKDDSDGDGATNGDEIRADTLPGDPKSRPASTPLPSKPVERVPPESQGGASIIPRHAFHPVLVHFPLALFIFGGALDLAGLARRNAAVRLAGLWNMTAASVATALAIPTGFLAASLSGYKLTLGSGVVTHLLFAAGGTVLMTLLVAWRSRAERRGPLYVAILLLTIAIVGFAGHLGGTLVYGG